MIFNSLKFNFIPVDSFIIFLVYSQYTSTWYVWLATGGIPLSAIHLYIPMWTRLTFVMFKVWPGIDVASHAPLEIVFSSSRTHSTEGWGNPFAGHRNRKWSPSRTTTDLGLSEPYSTAFVFKIVIIFNAFHKENCFSLTWNCWWNQHFVGESSIHFHLP